MFVRRFFEPKLAQTSYLIGDAAAGQAIVIDPNRDADPYIAAASAEGARITRVTETHIHADYLSGSRELAARTGAKLYLSDEGGADWQYAFARQERAMLLHDGDRIAIGSVAVDVVHTPGHTPEHLTFLVTDRTAANEPIAAVTGDFLFVGDVGRPDLLERAARLPGTMEASARTLYRSLQSFARRADWLQIWPGHGAGSACGKSISAIPQSTLGYEKRFNWAFQVSSEDEFVQKVLAGQPEPPKYFADMKRMNKEGPTVLGGFAHPPRLAPDALGSMIDAGALVLDTRQDADFAVGHVPGTINLPMTDAFTTWAGRLVPYTREIQVLVDERVPHAIDQVVRDLAMIGLDRITGYFDGTAIDAWAASGRPVGVRRHLQPADLAESLKHDGVTLVDLRSPAEWASGHIPGARHIPVWSLVDRLGEIPRDKPVVVHCAGGLRSAIGASLLRARGLDPVLDLSGGLGAWIKAGLPVVTD